MEIWPLLKQIIEEEIPSYENVENALNMVGVPTRPEQIGLSREEVVIAFQMTKDIRDKYIGSRLLWDLGLLEDVAGKLG